MIKRLLPWDGLGHEVVAHGGVLYIGGVIADDTSLDMAGQADDVLRQLAKLLAAGGSSIARVLQVTIYVTNLADKPDFNRVWKAHFSEVNLPARAAIGVADLGAGVKLELVATAAVDGKVRPRTQERPNRRATVVKAFQLRKKAYRGALARDS